MSDLLPGEIEKWQWLEAKARVFFESHGFKEIRTPLLESSELFTRSIGEASDIVHKEMFSFEDRGGRNISLRPEMTASVARAVIENGLLKTNKSLRLYYLGPLFRAERPQAGRKRQFHQIGVEIINEDHLGGFNADFYTLFLLCKFLEYVGLNNFRLRLNDLGDFEQQKRLGEKLRRYFLQQKARLCSDCQYRLEKNVLRMFDCKNESCQSLIDKVPWDKPSKEFDVLIDCIQSSKFGKSGDILPYEVDRRLVRGLDYYNGAVFEAAASGLGAQDAVAGGGRYDRLYSDLGGDPTPATGFSIGMERLLATLENIKPSLSERIRLKRIYLAPLEESEKLRAHVEEKALDLRQRGIRVETLRGESSLSNHLKKANQLGVRLVLILGSAEFEKRSWAVKDMEKKTQVEIPDPELGSYLEKELGP